MEATAPRSNRVRSMAMVAISTLAATLVCWFAVMPWDWSAVPTSDPDTFTSPVTNTHTIVVGVLAVALAVVAGALRHPIVPLLTVATPMLVLWCYQSATATVIGANMWVLGAMMLTPTVYVVIAAFSFAAFTVRVWRDRTRAERADGARP